MARRPDQRTQPLGAGTPGSRSGTGAEINFDTTGLALDTTVQQVNTTLGLPAQETTASGLLSQVVNSGAQPWVPNLASANALRNGAGAPFSFYTFPANSRIWRADLSYSAASNSSYSGGTITNMFAEVRTAGGVTLAVIELSLSGPTVAVQGQDPGQLPGLPVLAGDMLILNVNNGVALTDGNMRASVTVLYSTP